MTIYPGYSMSAEVLTSLAALPVGIQGARLLHGLYHIVGLGLTDPRLWHTNAMRQKSIRVAVLRRQSDRPARGTIDISTPRLQSSVEPGCSSGSTFHPTDAA